MHDPINVELLHVNVLNVEHVFLLQGMWPLTTFSPLLVPPIKSSYIYNYLICLFLLQCLSTVFLYPLSFSFVWLSDLYLIFYASSRLILISVVLDQSVTFLLTVSSPNHLLFKIFLSPTFRFCTFR